MMELGETGAHITSLMLLAGKTTEAKAQNLSTSPGVLETVALVGQPPAANRNILAHRRQSQQIMHRFWAGELIPGGLGS